VTVLDDMVPKYQRAFEYGAETSYRPNDNATGYIELAPSHLLTYEMAIGQDSFLASGRLKTLAKMLFWISTTETTQ
jgi:hypothetical protein